MSETKIYTISTGEKENKKSVSFCVYPFEKKENMDRAILYAFDKLNYELKPKDCCCHCCCCFYHQHNCN